MSVEHSTLDVGGSPRGAVFLSYASQDAEAAKRICDALRAAGVEVWFDQNELVGGDAWDAKIRGQISSCALFMPIISANTQARLEGYFRLEWKLAAQRTHTMADEKAFLLPILIDGTRDAEAKVPAEFKAVQWTKLPGGETPPAFCARAKKLLVGGTDAHEAAASSPLAASPKPVSPAKNSRWFTAGIVVLPLLTGLILAWWVLPGGRRAGQGAHVQSAPSAPAATTASPARQLAEQAWQMSERSKANPDGMRVASDMGERAIQQDSMDGEVWATAALVDIRCWVHGPDQTDQRQEMALTKIRRAKFLAPQALRTRLADAKVLVTFPRLYSRAAEAETVFRGLLKENPPEWEATDIRGCLGLALERQGRVSEAAPIFEEAGKQNAGWLNAASWAYLLSRQLGEALAIAKRESVLDSLAGGIQEWRVQIARGDLDAAQAVIDRQSAQTKSEETVATGAAFLHWYRKDAAGVLDTLQLVSSDFIFSPVGLVPKRYYSGWAHHLAGRHAAAQVEWLSALQAVERKIAQEGSSRFMLDQRCQLLALLGRQAEAEQAYTLLHELLPAEAMALDEERLAVLGRNEEAIAALTKALGAPRQVWFAHSYVRFAPSFAAIRHDPRVVKVLRETLPSGAKPLDDSEQADAAPAPDPKSIAVLPFENMSEDKDSGYFADGVQEDILTNLASLKELRVISRTSVERYRKTDKPVPQIARELGVAYVLEGSVRRAGNKVRVTGQLIRAATDEHLWAKSFDRDLNDIFAIQSELAQAIAAELKTAISPAEAARVEDRPTSNLEAYDLFLRARDNYNRMGAYGTVDEVRQIINILERVVQLDPRFAKAWQLLAASHGQMMDGGADSSEARKQQMWHAVTQTEQIAPDSLEAHSARGLAYYALRDYTRANTELTWLLQHFPRNAEVVRALAFIQRRWGRWSEALVTLRQAEALDPGNVTTAQNIALHLWETRRYAEARVAYRRLLELRPEQLEPARLPAGLGTLDFLERGSTTEGDAYFAALSPTELLSPGMVAQRKNWLVWKGDLAAFLKLQTEYPDPNVVCTEAAIMVIQGATPAAVHAKLRPFIEQTRAELLKEPENWNKLLALAWAEALAGESQAARADTERALRLVPVTNDAFYGGYVLSSASSIYAWAGETERATALLQERQNIPPLTSVHLIKQSPLWWPLRNDPRFQALVNDPKNNAPIY